MERDNVVPCKHTSTARKRQRIMAKKMFGKKTLAPKCLLAAVPVYGAMAESRTRDRDVPCSKLA